MENINQTWIRKQGNKLIEKYGGKHLILAKGEAFIGTDVKNLYKKARRKHPEGIITSMPNPTKEDLIK